MKKFSNKVVYVTGAARGIGRSILDQFGMEGATLAFSDISVEAVSQTEKELTKLGFPTLGLSCDVSVVSELEKSFKTIEAKFGRLDILVNNAGIQIRSPSLDFEEADYNKLMAVNLKATFFGCQLAGRIMRKNGGGAIVNISSGTSRNTTPGRAPYVISKAAVNALTAVLAAEWAEMGIRVNAVAPGWIMTQMVKDGIKKGVVSEKQIMSAVPVNRFAGVKEIADCVLYLASSNASYITGETIFVDGGWSALGLPIER